MTFGISAGTAALIGGGLAAAGSVAGAVIGGNAAQSAADTQAGAATYAADLQNQQWQQTQKNLKPYMDLGSSAINPLIQAMGYTTAAPVDVARIGFQMPPKGTPFFNPDGTPSQWVRDSMYAAGSANPYNPDAPDASLFARVDPNNPLQQRFSYADFKAPTAADAAATPGYQFTLQQGLKSVQNSAAARGLGTAGAALKGAANYSTGLADSTYNDVFSRALNTYNANFGKAQNVFNMNYASAANNVNRLMNLVGSGQNAAATNGSLGAAAAGNIGNTVMSGANAQAAGTVGSANAISNGLSGLGSNALTAAMLYNPSATTNNAVASYGAANPSNPTGYNVGSNTYGFTV